MKKTNPLADLLLEVSYGTTYAHYTTVGEGKSDPFNAERIVEAALQTLASDDRLPAEQRALAARELNKLFPDRGEVIDLADDGSIQPKPKYPLSPAEWDEIFVP